MWAAKCRNSLKLQKYGQNLNRVIIKTVAVRNYAGMLSEPNIDPMGENWSSFSVMSEKALRMSLILHKLHQLGPMYFIKSLTPFG